MFFNTIEKKSLTFILRHLSYVRVNFYRFNRNYFEHLSKINIFSAPGSYRSSEDSFLVRLYERFFFGFDTSI